MTPPPHVTTPIEPTPATTPDDAVTETIHQALVQRELLPREQLVDTSYTEADHLVSSRSAHGIDVVGLVAPDTRWQARAATGFALSQCRIDWAARRVTCPQGQQSTTWVPGQDGRGGAIIPAKFRRADCRGCLRRPPCTRSATQPRAVTLRPQAQHQALQAARQRQTTAEVKSQYAARAGAEGPWSQGVRAFSLRRARYWGWPRRPCNMSLPPWP